MRQFFFLSCWKGPGGRAELSPRAPATTDALVPHVVQGILDVTTVVPKERISCASCSRSPSWQCRRSWRAFWLSRLCSRSISLTVRPQFPTTTVKASALERLVRFVLVEEFTAPVQKVLKRIQEQIVWTISRSHGALYSAPSNNVEAPYLGSRTTETYLHHSSSKSNEIRMRASWSRSLGRWVCVHFKSMELILEIREVRRQERSKRTEWRRSSDYGKNGAMDVVQIMKRIQEQTVERFKVLPQERVQQRTVDQAWMRVYLNSRSKPWKCQGCSAGKSGCSNVEVICEHSCSSV